MRDLDILNQMIKDSAKVELKYRSKKPIVILEEPQEKNCSVKIHGLPDDVVVIKADAFKSPDSVFNGKNGECKRSDFIIVADAGSKKVIIFIELKKKRDDSNIIMKQLMGAKCFMTYCKEIGKSFWNKKDFLSEYDYRYVCIGHISIAKKPTRIKRDSRLHDEPGKMMKIDWPSHIQFNQLAGKCG